MFRTWGRVVGSVQGEGLPEKCDDFEEPPNRVIQDLFPDLNTVIGQSAKAWILSYPIFSQLDQNKIKIAYTINFTLKYILLFLLLCLFCFLRSLHTLYLALIISFLFHSKPYVLSGNSMFIHFLTRWNHLFRCTFFYLFLGLAFINLTNKVSLVTQNSFSQH